MQQGRAALWPDHVWWPAMADVKPDWEGIGLMKAETSLMLHFFHHRERFKSSIGLMTGCHGLGLQPALSGASPLCITLTLSFASCGV